MSEQNTIAMICDCDDTLCEDSTAFLLRELGIETDSFWRSVNLMIKKGWDPPLAVMRKLIYKINAGKIRLSNEDLTKMGKKIEFFPGVPEVFTELRSFASGIEETQDNTIELEYYVLTSGFEELIRGSVISPYVTEIFGCTFDSNPKTGMLRFPKSVITFTEKTKFIYAINKGIRGKVLRKSPYEVNNAIKEEQRRIPFRNMLYIGDGPSDVPCFSVVTKNDGYAIGVYEKKRTTKAWQLAKGKRLTVGPYPRNYSPGHSLRTWIERTIKEIALDISRRKELRNKSAPRYDE